MGVTWQVKTENTPSDSRLKQGRGALGDKWPPPSCILSKGGGVVDKTTN